MYGLVSIRPSYRQLTSLRSPLQPERLGEEMLFSRFSSRSAINKEGSLVNDGLDNVGLTQAVKVFSNKRSLKRDHRNVFETSLAIDASE